MRVALIASNAERPGNYRWKAGPRLSDEDWIRCQTDPDIGANVE